MAASGVIQPKYIHRKHGKLYYDIASLALNVDLLLDADGVPDATQNPNAVFIGATDAGYEFTAEPTIVEELVDEEDAPIEVNIDTIAAQISLDALEVADLARIAKMVPFANYSLSTIGSITHDRVTAGGDRLALPSKSIVVVSPEKRGGFLYIMFYKAYNSTGHQLQFKKTERSKQNMVIKGLSDTARDDGDRIYRIGYKRPAITIENSTPLTSVPEDTPITPFYITAIGGGGDYTFTVEVPALPPGITLSPDGLLSGTPTTVGANTFTIRATDQYGLFVDKAFSWTIT